MARETKADMQNRIEQLQKQILAAEKQISRLQAAADKDFSESAYKIQMDKEIEKWKRLYLGQKAHSESLQKQLTEIKKSYQEVMENQPDQEKQHNERNAGRKLHPTVSVSYGYVLDLIEKGKSYSEIAKICGISKSTVYRKLRQAKEMDLQENERLF